MSLWGSENGTTVTLFWRMKIAVAFYIRCCGAQPSPHLRMPQVTQNYRSFLASPPQIGTGGKSSYHLCPTWPTSGCLLSQRRQTHHTAYWNSATTSGPTTSKNIWDTLEIRCAIWKIIMNKLKRENLVFQQFFFLII